MKRRHSVHQSSKRIGQARAILVTLTAALLISGCAGTEDKPVRLPDTPPVEPHVVEPVYRGLAKAELNRQVAELREQKDFDFVLGKGDVISVSVYNEPDLDVKGVPVRPDGKISYLLIGDVQAAGRHVQEIDDEITRRLGEFVRDPKVSVIVEQFASIEYTIVGEVIRPGTYPLTGDVSLTKAIAKAGGLAKGQFHASSVELADLTQAFIARDGKVLPIDFAALLRKGDLRFDIPLHPDDYIQIPSGLAKEIYVLGEVGRPDLFAFREEMSLSKALVIAKGTTKDANLEQIHVVRGALYEPDVYVVNMYQVYDGEVRDVILQPGDIVYVPPTGISKWAHVLNQIMPSITALQTGLLLKSTLEAD